MTATSINPPRNKPGDDRYVQAEGWDLDTPLQTQWEGDRECFCTAPLQPSPLGLTTVLWIHTALIIFSMEGGIQSPCTQAACGMCSGIRTGTSTWGHGSSHNLQGKTPSGAAGNGCCLNPAQQCPRPGSEPITAAATSISLGLPPRPSSTRRVFVWCF